MGGDELRAELEIELSNMASLLDEVRTLGMELETREPTVRDLAAVGAFLSQLYNGVENVLKRFCRHAGLGLPSGPSSHVELVRLFTAGSERAAPLLFDAELAAALGPYRRFRHAFFHGYATTLDWGRLRDGLRRAPETFGRAIDVLREHASKHE